jgi:hypothetical protein
VENVIFCIGAGQGNIAIESAPVAEVCIIDGHANLLPAA